MAKLSFFFTCHIIVLKIFQVKHEACRRTNVAKNALMNLLLPPARLNLMSYGVLQTVHLQATRRASVRVLRNSKTAARRHLSRLSAPHTPFLS